VMTRGSKPESFNGRWLGVDGRLLCEESIIV
jgi:hypothetical protein